MIVVSLSVRHLCQKSSATACEDLAAYLVSGGVYKFRSVIDENLAQRSAVWQVRSEPHQLWIRW